MYFFDTMQIGGFATKPNTVPSGDRNNTDLP